MIQIHPVRLRQHTIDETASHLAASHNDFLVLGRHHHQRYPSDVFAQRLAHFAVPLHLLGHTLAHHARGLDVLALHPIAAMDGEILLAAADVRHISPTTAALAERQVINRLEQIGLANAVVTHKAVHIGAEIHIKLAIRLEIAYLQIGQIHLRSSFNLLIVDKLIC